MASSPPANTTSTSVRSSDPGVPSTIAPDPSPHGPICFRICGIPSCWSRSDLGTALQDIDPELDLNSSQLSALFPACCDTSQTALLTVEWCTEYLNIGPNQEKYHVFPANDRDGDREVRLRIDKHFYGLTPMNHPQHQIRADVIAITGLSGHAFGSWRSRVGDRPLDRPMWLRDFLPEKFPQTRIMTYGYDSSLSKPNGCNIRDHTLDLEQCVMNARRDCPGRPIIFIGHSMGGILVVQLLLKWSLDPEPGSMLNCVHGIFFFGTPHNGLRIKELREMVGRGVWSDKTQTLLSQLAEGSEFLENQKDSLSRMWNRLKAKVFSFYETEMTNAVKMVAPTVFRRSGGKVQIVQRSSSQLFLPDELRFPIQSNHTDMVKFKSSDDKAFQDVVTCMDTCVVQYNRATAIKTLLQTVLPGQTTFYIDQQGYYEKSKEPSGLEERADFLLLLHNLDYQKWISTTDEVKTLVYTRFPSLPYLAPHLLRALRSMGETCLLLHFSFSSIGSGMIRPIHGGVKGKIAGMVWTFIHQTLETLQEDQKQCLLKEFLQGLLTTISDDEVMKAQKNIKTAFDTIITLLEPESLWDAFEKVCVTAADLYRCPGPNQQHVEQSLKFIVDLDQLPVEHWQMIMLQLRRVMQRLRPGFSTIKLLIMHSPDTQNGLPLLPSEVLVSYDQERQECLHTLNFKNPRYDKIELRHGNTLSWLWESCEYKSWVSLSYPDSGILFIEGKPGSGKSTLVRYFADHFNPPRGAIVASFFYNSRDGESERDHRSMLKSLLFQMLEADESLFIHFQSTYRRNGAGRMEWSSENMKDVLRACKTHPRPRRVYLIIDAMDESECTDRLDIVRFLYELSLPAAGDGTGCFYNVFLASRPINELQPVKWPGRWKLQLQDMNRGDIERYAHSILQSEEFDSVKVDVKEEIEKYVIKCADGVFLWVSLVLKELAGFAMNGSRKSTLLKFLKSLPKSLESLYECMLQALDNNNPQDRMDGKRILQFCLFSERQIELIDLEHALAIPGSIEDDEPDFRYWESEIPGDIRKMLTHCIGGFIDVKESTKMTPVVQVMHQTVREFFLRARDLVRRSHLDVIDHQDAQTMIQLTCVRFLEVVQKEGVKYKIPQRVGESSFWADRLVEYLEKRPFIRFSLEYLKENMDRLAPEITDRLSHLLSSVKESHNSLPTVLLNCLLLPTLTSQGSGVDVQDRLDSLILASAARGYLTAIRNLAAASGSIDAHNIRKETLLHLAAKGGHYAATRFLLDSGVDPGAQDIWGRTALHHAAIEGQEALVQLFLASRADLGAQDENGGNALHFAAEHGHEPVVRLLLAKNVDLLACDMKGRNGLYLAALNGHEAIVRLLLTCSENVQGRVRHGHEGLGVKVQDMSCKALHLAARHGYAAAIKLLLRGGVDVQARDDQNRNALYFAAQYGYNDVFQLLLESGIDNKIYKRPLRLISLSPGYVMVQVSKSRCPNFNDDDWPWNGVYGNCTLGTWCLFELLSTDFGRDTTHTSWYTCLGPAVGFPVLSVYQTPWSHFSYDPFTGEDIGSSRPEATRPEATTEYEILSSVLSGIEKAGGRFIEEKTWRGFFRGKGTS